MSSAIDPLKVSDKETLAEIAAQEQIPIDRLQAGISSGEIVVFGNAQGPVRPLAIGAPGPGAPLGHRGRIVHQSQC